MITPSNIARHELTGLCVIVVGAHNPTHTGVSGTVLDETKNMLVIAGDKKRMIPKAGSVFRFTLPVKTVVDVDGGVLIHSPEKRINARIRYQR